MTGRRKEPTSVNDVGVLQSHLEREEHERELSYGPFSEADLGDVTVDSRYKQETRRLFRAMLSMYQTEVTLPDYGRTGFGDGVYGAPVGVVATDFRDYLLQFVPDGGNAIGTFLQRTPILNKRGVKVTERLLLRRVEDLYMDAKPITVLQQTHDLCAHIVMSQQVEALVERLEDVDKKPAHARLHQVRLYRIDQVERMALAIENNCRTTLQSFSAPGAHLGSHPLVTPVKTATSNGTAAHDAESRDSDAEDETTPGKDAGAMGSAIDVLTAALGRVKSLVSVDLSSNALTDREIGTISRLRQVHTLNLSNNYIDDAAAMILADSLPLFRALQSLSLGRNMITDLGAVKLLAALTSHFKLPIPLRVLRVEYNQIRGRFWRVMAQLLPETKNLALLDVSGNTLTNESGDADAFQKALAKNRSLTVLHMDGLQTDAALCLQERTDANFYEEHVGPEAIPFDVSVVYMGDDMGGVVGPVLSANRLVKLDLSNNMISPLGLRELVQGLCAAKRLRELDLSWNDIRDKGALQLSKMLKSNKSNLVDLNVSYNQIGPRGVMKIMRTLAKGVRKTAMKRLDVSGNVFSKEDVPLLNRILNSRNQQLEELHMNNMGCRSLWHLCTAVGDRNRALKVLAIARNGISFVKVSLAEEFAFNMLRSRSLERLDLSHNALGDDGALAFARHIGKNRTLKHLDISANGLTKPSAYGLGRGLVNNRTLTSLFMRWNYIGSTGASALLDMMGANPTLTTVDCAGYGVPYRLKEFDHGRGTGVFHSVDALGSVKSAQEKAHQAEQDEMDDLDESLPAPFAGPAPADSPKAEPQSSEENEDGNMSARSTSQASGSSANEDGIQGLIAGREHATTLTQLANQTVSSHQSAEPEDEPLQPTQTVHRFSIMPKDDVQFVDDVDGDDDDEDVDYIGEDTGDGTNAHSLAREIEAEIAEASKNKARLAMAAQNTKKKQERDDQLLHHVEQVRKDRGL